MQTEIGSFGLRLVESLVVSPSLRMWHSSGPVPLFSIQAKNLCNLYLHRLFDNRREVEGLSGALPCRRC